MKISTPKIVIGSILILIGISTLFSQFNLLGSFRPWELWPLILVLVGIMWMLRKSYLIGMILIILGAAFLASNIWNYSFIGVLWPLLIIVVGVSMFFRPYSGKINNSSSKTDESKINDTILFWGEDKKIQSKDFTGGKIDCTFGGFKLDLRDAYISKDGAKLDINCAFGGGEIWVNKNMRIESEGTALFGGWENNFVTNTDTSQPLLKITGNVLFGGVEIKN